MHRPVKGAHSRYLHSTMYLLNLAAAITGFLALLFTFHYVSIKSWKNLHLSCTELKFTFHYVSIKSYNRCHFYGSIHNLHSTMYLLNRSLIGTSDKISNIFTFHYVSIKSSSGIGGLGDQGNLHSTMYLLNHVK